MYEPKSDIDRNAEGSSPSAPPIVVTFEDTVEHPLQTTTRPPPVSHLSGDSQLVRDLLHKADGDTTKVSIWLDGMGERVTPADVMAVADQEMVETNVDDIDAVAAKAGAPETYFCPVSYHLFRDPVLLQTGQTYERSVIQRWLCEGGSICPITGVQLPRPVTLTPNHALRQAVEEWALNNVPWMLGANGRILPLPEDQRNNFALQNQVVTRDADTALAIRLQQEEIDRQRRIRSRVRPHNGDMTQTRYDRVRRCTLLILAFTIIYVVMFIYTLFKSEWKFEKIDSNPLIGFKARMLRRTGGTNTYLIAEHDEWWRWITSIYMTAGLVHLQWVICCLWTFGRFLAARMSFLSLGLLYMTSSICGVLLSANLSVKYDTVAGSAGTFGLMGAVCVEILIHRKHYNHHVTSFFFLAFSGIVGVIIGLTPFVDNWANLGGLIGGISMALAMRLTYRGLQRSGCWFEWMLIAIQVFWLLLVCLFIVAGCIGLVVDRKSREDCVWCERLTCVDTKWWDCEMAILPPDDVGCEFTLPNDLLATVRCPTGLKETRKLSDYTQKTLDQFCSSVCSPHRKESRLPDDSGQQLPIPSVEPVSPGHSMEEGSLGSGNVLESTTE